METLISDNEFLRRAYAAYNLLLPAEADLPSGLTSRVEAVDAKAYAVLRNANGILAVYRLTTSGGIRRLRRWPKALSSTSSQATEERIIQIEVHDSDFFDGWIERASIDEAATFTVFAEAMEARLIAAHPGATLTYVADMVGRNKRALIKDSRGDTDAIRRTMSDITDELRRTVDVWTVRLPRPATPCHMARMSGREGVFELVGGTSEEDWNEVQRAFSVVELVYDSLTSGRDYTRVYRVRVHETDPWLWYFVKE